MGSRGPAPEPSAIRLIKGNPSKKPINRAEPRPDAVIPDCPGHLDKRAKQEWATLCPILSRMRVLTEADYMALANLCQEWSTMVQCQMQINEVGMLVEGPSGQPIQNPLMRTVKDCMANITLLGREFGLTPSSRGRISVEPEVQKKNAFAALG